MVQTITIFTNVSKGVLAKHEDLQLVFGTTNQDKICRIILTEGEMQVRRAAPRAKGWPVRASKAAGTTLRRPARCIVRRPFTEGDVTLYGRIHH